MPELMEVYVMARPVDIGFLRLQTIVAKSDGFSQSGNELSSKKAPFRQRWKIIKCMSDLLWAHRIRKNETKALRILPLISGYRDKDNGRIYLTTDYKSVYQTSSVRLNTE